MPDKKGEPVLDEGKWAILLDKYGDLMLKISHQISGDVMYGFEDTLQEYYFVSVDAIKGFEKHLKAGTILTMETCVDWDFYRYVKSRPFDKYYKSCLWHCKNKIGQGIVARKDINKALSFSDFPRGTIQQTRRGEHRDHELYVEPLYEYDFDSSIYLEELKAKFEGTKADLIDAIVTNPNTLMSTGRINVEYLAEILNLKPHQVRRELDTLGELFVGN